MIPETLQSVKKTQRITNIEPTKLDNKHTVAMLIAKVAKRTFRYNSLRIICDKN